MKLRPLGASFINAAVLTASSFAVAGWQAREKEKGKNAGTVKSH